DSILPNRSAPFRVVATKGQSAWPYGLLLTANRRSTVAAARGEGTAARKCFGRFRQSNGEGSLRLELDGAHEALELRFQLQGQCGVASQLEEPGGFAMH